MIDIAGRPSEAAAIARFAERVPNGPVGLSIEGEPGIGKTTLVSAAIETFRARGYRVLHARPAEAEAHLSFAVLGDLLNAVFDETREALPPPQRQALDTALLRRDPVQPADPRTTATALLTVLTVLSSRDLLVLALDDAQWIDEASRRALEFAVRRLPERVGIVVASRTSDGKTTAFDLEQALGAGRVQRLVIGPLSLAALHALIRSRLGVNLVRPMLLRVAAASGGNPFFALEISAAIAPREGGGMLGEVLPVPRSLQELLRDRFDRLSVPARAVVSAAAALSRPTGGTIEAALGSDYDVGAALAEAEAAGVLVLDPDRLHFTHPLLASTIYGLTTGVLRRALHRRLAAVATDAEERARHLARSVVGADEDAARAIETGAIHAARAGAPESAAELYDAACRLTPDERSEDLARRMLEGAQALRLAGDLHAARSRATRALDSGRAPSTRARALLLLGDLATYTETIESRVDYQERALTEAGDDRALRIEVLLALFRQIAGNPERAGQGADEAIQLLREGGADRPALARALIYKFVAELVLGRGAQIGLLDEALALEDDPTRPAEDGVRPGQRGGPLSTYPLIWFHWIDDLEAVRARFRLLTQSYEDRGDVVDAVELVEFIAMAEFRAGNWPAAEQALEAACDTLAQFEVLGPLSASFADRSVIDAHRGRIDRARETLDGILGVDGLDPFWRMVCHSAQGAVEFSAGNYEAADLAWTQMRNEARAVGWIDNLEDRSEPDHVEALLALGKLDDARRVLEHLEWRARTLPRAWIDAGLPRARALILAAESRVADALAAIEAAPRTPRLPFETARLLLVRGQLERRANRKLAARDSLTAALNVFEELGSPPWVTRARAELGRLGLRHRGADELTETERRIAELAATGKTNREVADAAFVSPKTVEANLARVYRKLGIASRAELGARMAAESRGGEPET